MIRQSQRTQQRFAILAVVIAVFAPFAVRAARQAGWIPSKQASVVFAIVMAVCCIVGGFIAYRTTQIQVRRDMDEVNSAGKADR